MSERSEDRRRTHEEERRRSRARRPISLAVAGGITYDRVKTWTGETREGLGGILHNVVAWAVLTRPEDRILPIAWLGDDLRERVEATLAPYPQVDRSGLLPHPNGTNRVELTYESPARRTEVLSSRVPPLGPAELARGRGADLLLVNMISGFDLTPSTLLEFTSDSPTPVYLDIQSLTLDVAEDGTRSVRTVPDWREWCQHVRVLKGAEEELLLFSGDPPGGHRAALARVAREGPSVVATRAERGGTAVYRVGTQWLRYVFPALPGIEPADTTGSGDVFQSAMVLALHRGRTFPEALLFASAAAGLACTARGVEELRRLEGTERAMEEGYRAELAAIREGYRGEEVDL